MMHPLLVAVLDAHDAKHAAGEGDEWRAAADRLAEATAAWYKAGRPRVAPPPPNTVPVRIPVGVDSHRRWRAMGGTDIGEAHAFCVIGVGREGVRLTFLTGHAYLPEPPAEVEGEVDDG